VKAIADPLEAAVPTSNSITRCRCREEGVFHWS